jgi:hypothetical protein
VGAFLAHLLETEHFKNPDDFARLENRNVAHSGYPHRNGLNTNELGL